MATEVAQGTRAALPDLRGAKIMENPILRQVGVMVGVALSVALGVAVVLWSQTPSYSLLYGSLSDKDAPAVMEALQQAGIAYKVDSGNGAVTVPTADLHTARMKLAALGLPRGDNLGFELLQQDTGFATSHSMEAVRFQRALEGELARSIATLSPVDSARVHLATPRQSVFVRERKHPSASVVLKLYPGRALDKGQVKAIEYLVASSVPELSPSRVTVVDQSGELLSGGDHSKGMGLTSAQFDYTRELERHYKQRIQDLLTPVLGADSVHAEVTADLDFSVTEKTRESYDPDQPALRSEQTQEQQSQLSPVEGVPGALSNQPPAAGTSPQQTQGQAQGQAQGQSQDATTAKTEPINTSKRETRNFELDKTVSHTQLPTGSLRRLSVAVVVDDRQVPGVKGAAATRVPRTPEEMSRIETLVREAVGYDARRGDSIQVVNASFQTPEAVAPLPQPPMWEQSWFWDVVREVGGVLLVLVLIFGVLKPTMKRLTAPAAAEAATAAAGTAGGARGEGPEAVAEEGLDASLEDDEYTAALPPGEKVRLPGPGSYESTLDAARQLVRDDPKRVAQVVRRWIAEEAA